MSHRGCVAKFLTIVAKSFDGRADHCNLTCKIALRRNRVLNRNGLAFVLQKRIAQFGICRNAIGDFAEDRAGRRFESKINSEFFSNLRSDQPIWFCLMHWLDRFAHSLDEPVIVRERAIDLGKRSRGKDNVGEGGRVRLEQFLHQQKIKFAQTV